MPQLVVTSREDVGLPIPFADAINFPWLRFEWARGDVMVYESQGDWVDGTWVLTVPTARGALLGRDVRTHSEALRICRSFLRGVDRGEESQPLERQYRRQRIAELRRRHAQGLTVPLQPRREVPPSASSTAPIEMRVDGFAWVLFEWHRQTQQVYLLELPGDWVTEPGDRVVWTPRGGVHAVRGQLLASGVESYAEYQRVTCSYVRGIDRGIEAGEAERSFRCQRIAEFKRREPGHPVQL